MTKFKQYEHFRKTNQLHQTIPSGAEKSRLAVKKRNYPAHHAGCGHQPWRRRFFGSNRLHFKHSFRIYHLIYFILIIVNYYN